MSPLSPDAAEPGRKAINLAPLEPLLEPRAGEHRLLRVAAGQRPLARRLRDGARDPVPPAALRVLRRLRRVRRDALPQGAHPALRRAADRGQRDRLLVDLRRQPADDAVDEERAGARDRPGRTRSSRTTPSSGSGCGSPPTCTRGWPASAWPSSRDEVGADLADAILGAGQVREFELTAQRERVAELMRRLGGAVRAGRSTTCAASPTTSCGAPSGSSGATAGPTTSGPAASTTCCRAGATSTSSSSTPRSTPTPAGSRRRRRRSVRWPSSRPPARPWRRRTSPSRPSPTATSTSPGWRWAPTRTRRSRRSARPRPTTGRRSIIAYSHCIAHGIEMSKGLDQQYRAVASRALAARPLRPGGAGGRGQPVPARLAAAAHPAGGLHLQRAALPDAARLRPRRGRAAAPPGAGGGRPAVADLRGDGDPRRGRTSPADARGGRRDGPVDELPRPAAAQPARRERLPAVAAGRPGAGPRRRRGGRGRHVLALRGGGAPAAAARPHGHRDRTRTRSARPCRTSPTARRALRRPVARTATCACSSSAAAAVDVPVIASLNGSTPGRMGGLRAVDAGRRRGGHRAQRLPRSRRTRTRAGGTWRTGTSRSSSR